MDENALISAEAIVTSKRPDHVSVFEANLDALTENPKRFYADPTLIKEAVQRFKRAGFIVTSVDKFGVSILGIKQLFEETFKVRLVAQPVIDSGQPSLSSPYYVADVDRAWLIDPRQSNFKDLLDGVILAQPSQLLMMEDLGGSGSERPHREKDWYLYPEEIPMKLNAPKGLKLKGKIRIVVIDTGCDFNHPYFAGANIRVINSNFIEKSLKASEAIISETSGQGESGQIINARKNIETFSRLDSWFHGTNVVANLVSIVPDAEIIVIKAVNFDTELGSDLWQAINLKPNIISISLGVYVPPNAWEIQAQMRAPLLGAMQEAIKRNIVVIVGAGNKESRKELMDKISILPQLCPDLITVGGAYYPEQSQEPSATDMGHGYQKDFGQPPLRYAVPNICGLCGPAPGYIYCPMPLHFPDKWDLHTATSLATPQIAGVCALMLDSCPALTPRQIKEIMMRTATAVQAGRTTQEKLLQDIKFDVGEPEPVSPGLVNIKRAVKVAELVNLIIDLPKINHIERAISLAKKELGNNW